jgi:uncharacterized phage infection (PIP) family protein YhgE
MASYKARTKSPEARKSNLTITKSPGVKAIAVKTNEDVSDNSKLFKAMTTTVGDMLTEISSQMVEFEQMRTAADDKAAKRFDKIEKGMTEGQKHMEILEIVTLLMSSHGKNHDMLKGMLSEAGGNSNKMHSKVDKSLEAVQGLSDGHKRSQQAMEKAIDQLGGLANSHDGLHGKVKSLDARLASLEKTGQQTLTLLQQIKNQQDGHSKSFDSLSKNSDISKVKGWLDDHSKNLHGKLDGHTKTHDKLTKMLDGIPDHATLLKGVHGAISDHMGDHAGKIMHCIARLPLPPDEKMLLQAMENMQEAALTQTLESIDKLKRQFPDMSQMKGWLDDHSKNLHGKLDGHSKNHDKLAQMMDGMPDHDALMKGVHGLLSDHLGDHSGKLMNQINKLPLPPDEKILLQALENMQEAALGQTLESIEKLKRGLPDIGAVKGWIDDHGKSLHAKLDNHSKNHDNLAKMLDTMPDHDTLMNGVHGLLGDHLGDHSGKVMNEINKLPLPPDEKILLQAIENMQEASLGQVMEAIEKVHKDVVDGGGLDAHAKDLHGKLDGLLDSMPDHGELMKGVHGLLSDHIGDHSGNILGEINKLPLPPDEKVLLQAIEDVQEASLTRTLEAIEKVKLDLQGHTDALHDRFDNHGKGVEEMAKMLDGMPDHDTLLKGVHGLLGEHIGDHSGQVMSQIDKLPLPPDEKILLQSIENIEENVLSTMLEAIEGLKKVITQHGDSLDDLHGKVSGHGAAVDELSKMMDGMPNHEELMSGVHGLLGEHLGDGHGKIMSEIASLPLDQSQKVMLQAMENMEESVLTTMLEAIEKVQKSVDPEVIAQRIEDHSKGLHDLMHDKLDGMLTDMPDHGELMKGVHGLLSDHLGDHSGNIQAEINKLPLPPDEKVLLQAIENIQEQSLTTVLESIEKLREHMDGHGEEIAKLKDHIEGHGDAVSGAFDDHGKKVEQLLSTMESMPDHDTLMKGVHGLLGDHMGDHSGKVMDEINKLPLPPSEKVMLQAIENMEETMMTTILEAIEKVMGKTTDLHGKLDGHGKAVVDIVQQLESMPDHDKIMGGVNDMLLGHLGDGHGKIASAIDALPLDKSEKVMLQAIESMEDSVCTTLLEAIQNIQMNVTVQGANMAQVSASESPAVRATPRSSRASSPEKKPDSGKFESRWSASDKSSKLNSPAPSSRLGGLSGTGSLSGSSKIGGACIPPSVKNAATSRADSSSRWSLR